MANFEKKKIDLSSINGGVRYENGDIVTADAINVPIEGIGYVQEIAEKALGKAKTFYLHKIMFSNPNGGALNPNNKYFEVFVINTLPNKPTAIWQVVPIITGRGVKPPIFKSCIERNNSIFSVGINGYYDILCCIQTGSEIMSIGILSDSGQILMEQDLRLISAEVQEYDL